MESVVDRVAGPSARAAALDPARVRVAPGDRVARMARINVRSRALNRSVAGWISLNGAV
jgi:plastocyanin